MAKLAESKPGTICKECHPEEFPKGERQSEGHIAIRFGDGYNWRVWLDDKEISNRTIEACAGKQGFVVIYEESETKLFLCACNRGAAMSIVYGDVRVQTMAA